MNKKVIAIIGPTASGKTKLSLDIAKKHNGYIISADSRQIYKGMNIGTGKIKQEEMQNIPHFLLNIISPNEEYNVSHFVKDAEKIIKKENGLPVVIGGTGLFVDSLLQNKTFPPVKPDQKFREECEIIIKNEGLEKLAKSLKEKDKKAYEKIDIQNPRKVIRALEVIEKTGKKFSSFKNTTTEKYNTLYIGLNPEKEKLYKNIEKRVDQMIGNNLEKEVKDIINTYGKNIHGMNSIGYKEWIPYFNKKISKDEVVESIMKNTKKYAKRQMTWFKRNKKTHWIKSNKEALELTKKFLSNQKAK